MGRGQANTGGDSVFSAGDGLHVQENCRRRGRSGSAGLAPRGWGRQEGEEGRLNRTDVHCCSGSWELPVSCSEPFSLLQGKYVILSHERLQFHKITVKLRGVHTCSSKEGLSLREERQLALFLEHRFLGESDWNFSSVLGSPWTLSGLGFCKKVENLRIRRCPFSSGS